MGNELQGAVQIGKERHEGKIILETSELIFRGADFRVKLAFTEMKKVLADAGILSIRTEKGVFAFEVGTVAAKWREKILHPKTRAEKLGLKANTEVRLVGAFETGFLQEVKYAKVQAGVVAAPQNTFIAIATKSDLKEIAKHAKKISGSDALWVVYPKGKKDLTENDVIAAGRKAGLKDLKVVGFSAINTALKFVLPLEKR
jgi:hypothetical protein